MVDWVKIISNGLITGAITLFSTLTANGTMTSASIIAAVLAGAISFFVEVQKGSQITSRAAKETASEQPKTGSKLTIF